MKHSFTCTQTITGDADSVWAVWADPDSYPTWDPREERATLHGRFAVGSTIDSKQRGNPGGTAEITAVDPGRRWTATSPLPGGSLVIDHLVEPVGPGQVRVGKTYTATGPLSVLFRFYYGPKVARALPASFAALEQEAARRG